MCRGEAFGSLGYVGREFTGAVRRYADEKGKSMRELIVEVIDPDDYGKNDIPVAIS